MFPNKLCYGRFSHLSDELNKKPVAVSLIRGGADHPLIKGVACIYETMHGTLVAVEVSGLPTVTDKCKRPVFAFHIHSGGKCTGNSNDEFADTLTHYNPDNCPHPFHSGDLPPIFSSNGYTLTAFVTNRFTPQEVIGKTFIIHSNPDDFHTNPSGNSGVKIACGEIMACWFYSL